MTHNRDKAKWAAYMREWRKPHASRLNTKRRNLYAGCADPTTRAAMRKEYDRRHAAKVHTAYRILVDGFKASPCLDCGNCFPPECMDFDHVRGVKVFSIGQFGQRKLDHVIAEIAKCDLVCANCHRVRTRKRQVVV